MSGLTMNLKVDKNDFHIIGGNFNLPTIPEEQFFKMQSEGRDTGNYLPLPLGVTRWNDALYMDKDVLFAEADGHLYVIADDDKQGLALFHYMYANENDSVYRYSNNLPCRSIKIRKDKIFMNALAEMARNAGNARGMVGMPGMNPMDLNPNAGFVAGDGISNGAANIKNITNTALVRGFVFGYIMKNAPAITIQMGKEKQKDGKETRALRAKQSKPSGLLEVLMAIPSQCILRAGNIADVETIKNGLVDYKTTPEDEMTYLSVDENGAVGYVTAFGGKLPEYRPNVVEGESTQWSAAEILSNSPDVSFVTLKGTENRKRKNSSDDRYNWHLKTTSPRRCLYTPNNIMCLRALEHVNVPANGICKNADQADMLNECAFGGWRYRDERVKGVLTGHKVLQANILAKNDQIWSKVYQLTDAQGQPYTKEDGIGSIYFMENAVEKTDGGTEVKAEAPKYVPWYATGSNKKMENVPAIVKRVKTTTKDGKSERMANCPVTWKDVQEGKKEGANMFAPYNKFVAEILKKGFVTEEYLKSLNGKSQRSTKKGDELTADQKASLSNFLRSEAVTKAIDRVQNTASQRALLGK